MPLGDLEAEEMQSATRGDWLAESYVVGAAKPDEASPPHDLRRVKRCELPRGLDHDDAWQQRPAGEVAGDPELIVAHILEPDDPASIGVDVDDRVKVLHVPTLGVHLMDRFLIVEHLVEVDARQIVKKLRRHEKSRYRRN